MFKSFVFAGLFAIATGKCTDEEYATAGADCLKENPDATSSDDDKACPALQKLTLCVGAKCPEKCQEEVDKAAEEAKDDDDESKDCAISCGGCFPGDSLVELQDGAMKNMDALEVGDKVRVGPNEFSEVYFFSTSIGNTKTQFVKIHTDEAEVTLTASHFLYANGKLVEAKDVKTGDDVILANNSKSTVRDVSTSWEVGLYNPHTMHGDIVVDGVLTSTYTNAVHPKLAHALLSPLRTMYANKISFGQSFSSFTKGLPQWLLKSLQA